MSDVSRFKGRQVRSFSCDPASDVQWAVSATRWLNVTIGSMTEPSFPAETNERILDDTDVGQVIGYRLAQASIATTEQFEQWVGNPLGLRPVEYTVLSVIHQNPGVSGGSIARFLAMTASNMVAWIARLEDKGLVKRESSATDGRRQSLRTTAAGTKLVKAATQRLVEADRRAFHNLSSAEHAMLLELLGKVATRRAR